MTQVIPGVVAPYQSPEKIRSRDVQMTAVAFLETRTILVSGTLETSDRAVMVTYDLPSEGEWTFIKVETNLSDQSWSSWIMSVDEDGEFVENPACPAISQQFAYSVDHRRLGFFDGEVRPGEAVLKQFTVRAPSRRFYMSHGQRHRPQFAPIDEIFSEILEGYVLDSSYEIYVPVEIRY
jgi:hypothetical protein